MLLNIFGVTLAGSVAQTSDIICDYAREVGSGDQATILGRGERSTPTLAALVNGTMAHVLDFDEHVARRGNHPSNTLMPTVLAVGEQLGVLRRGTCWPRSSSDAKCPPRSGRRVTSI